MNKDEAATVRTLNDCREEIGLMVRQHRGRVVDTAGDRLLAEFPTATNAVSCAVDIQNGVGVRNAALAPKRRMEFRIGVHLGEVGLPRFHFAAARRTLGWHPSPSGRVTA